MSRERHNTTIRLLAVVVTGLSLAGPARGDAAPVGTVRTLPVITVCLAVGSAGKDTKRVVYTPPPGWYIRSHRVECAKKFGLSSYTVSTVPANWQWSSDERVTESARVNAAASATIPTAPVGGGQVAAETDRSVAGRQQTASSHHALVVEAVATGAGLFRGGAGVELTVTAELVYLGTP